MILRSAKLSKSNSFFLFGPRGSGKTTLLGQTFDAQSTLFIDLLNLETFDEFVLEPSRFSKLINQTENQKKRVIIDEVQKLPKLLDVVHSEIHRTKRQFIMTGSSSRRLKQSGVNLLAGRAWVYDLFPFSYLELEDHFDLRKSLEWGGLPEAYEADDKQNAREFLNAYVGTYLEKEIQYERWVKNLEPFRKFLAIAAQMNGKIVNKSKIAQQIGMRDSTVSNYFEILEDTLIGFFLPAHDKSVRKVQILSPKFFFIDTGIKRSLDRTLSVELLPQTYAWGDAFEHWVILEFKKNISYARLDWEMSYIKTKDDVEIDLIIDRPGMKNLMIEIKSSERVSKDDAKSLLTLGNDLDRKAEKWLISCDPLEHKFENVRALHWQKAVKELFK